jgi:transmembrane sensor
MGDGLDWQLLDRFLADECTPDERAEVIQWLETRPLAARYVEALRRVVLAEKQRAGPWETDAAWVRLSETTGITPRPEPAPPIRLVGAVPSPPGSLSPSLRSGQAVPERGDAVRVRLLRIAAALALMAGAALWWSDASRPQVAMRDFTTARGQRTAIQFVDGTKIRLSVDSRLRVPVEYRGRPGDVYLEGEAYFEATHDSARPFVVHAGQGVIRDLGTRFGVRAYPDERHVQVVVAEGTVSLSAAGERDSRGPVLGAGDLGRLDHTGKASVRTRVDTRRYLAWTEGRLAFTDAPLRDVLPQLARWYDLDLTLAASSLADRRVTFSVQGEPITHVLDAIALLTHARYERSGRRVTLYPQP